MSVCALLNATTQRVHLAPLRCACRKALCSQPLFTFDLGSEWGSRSTTPASDNTRIVIIQRRKSMTLALIPSRMNAALALPARWTSASASASNAPKHFGGVDACPHAWQPPQPIAALFTSSEEELHARSLPAHEIVETAGAGGRRRSPCRHRLCHN